MPALPLLAWFPPQSSKLCPPRHFKLKQQAGLWACLIIWGRNVLLWVRSFYTHRSYPTKDFFYRNKPFQKSLYARKRGFVKVRSESSCLHCPLVQNCKGAVCVLHISSYVYTIYITCIKFPVGFTKNKELWSKRWQRVCLAGFFLLNGWKKTRSQHMLEMESLNPQNNFSVWQNIANKI